MSAPVLVIAIGNESRGDDALAPMLLRRLHPWLAGTALGERVELLEDFQLQIEHAADLVGRELVLFVDAGMDTPAPFAFWRVEPEADYTPFSHALKPEAVLATYTRVYREAPPAAFVLCLRGVHFELGSLPSPEAARHLESALQFVQALLQHEKDAWLERATAPLAL